ncbi:MAG TPA: hypothetical protein VMF04_00535 [Thermoplasmata archaeon]|nr:hypothetical protein [Thermoplasmata archaeon]
MSEILVPLTAQTAYELLILEVTLATLLLVGGVLARLGHIRTHRALPSSIVLVNLPIGLATLLPPPSRTGCRRPRTSSVARSTGFRR